MKRLAYLLMIWVFLICPLLIMGQKIRVVSSASIFKDMVEQIGGDQVEAYSIVPIGGDPHLYDPRPSDAQLVKQADLILVNGLTFEGWINELIENSGTKAETVLITKGIDAIKSQKYQNAADPHAWMDASNGLVYIKNIKDALVRVAPEQKDFFEIQYKAYAQKLNDLDAYIMDAIQKIPEEHRMLVTSHDAFAYYGKRYGIRLNALKGISTDAEIKTDDIRRVTQAIQKTGVPAIFIESTINPKVIQQIAADTGIKIGGELFADSIGSQNSDAPTYYDMLKHNTDVIVKALSSGELTKTKIDQDDTSSNIYAWIGLSVLMLISFIFIFRRLNQ